MWDFDVVIIGGGPTGCILAEEIGDEVSVLVVEEDKEIGKPIRCAGFVSERCIKEADAYKSILKQKNKIVIHSPKGKSAVVNTKENLFVIKRDKFDQIIFKRAIKKKKVEFELNTKAIRNDGNAILLRNKDGLKTVRARIIVGADGALSNVAKWFSFPPVNTNLYAFQTYIPHNKEEVEVFWGKDIAPSFFSWIIPENGTARIGLASQENPYFYFKNFLNRFTDEKLKITGGVIPIGARKNTVKGNVLLVGDAAGQVKPTSGGGLYTGIRCAKEAANAIKEVIFSEDIKKLSKYERNWRKKIGRELYFGMLIHKIRCRISDEERDRFVSFVSHCKELVENNIDIDYLSKIAKKMWKYPATWREILCIIPPYRFIPLVIRSIFK